jgi:hypothetical protein
VLYRLPTESGSQKKGYIGRRREAIQLQDTPDDKLSSESIAIGLICDWRVNRHSAMLLDLVDYKSDLRRSIEGNREVGNNSEVCLKAQYPKYKPSNVRNAN